MASLYLGTGQLEQDLVRKVPCVCVKTRMLDKLGCQLSRCVCAMQRVRKKATFVLKPNTCMCLRIKAVRFW